MIKIAEGGFLIKINLLNILSAESKVDNVAIFSNCNGQSQLLEFLASISQILKEKIPLKVCYH